MTAPTKPGWYWWRPHVPGVWQVVMVVSWYSSLLYGWRIQGQEWEQVEDMGGEWGDEIPSPTH